MKVKRWQKLCSAMTQEDNYFKITIKSGLQKILQKQNYWFLLYYFCKNLNFHELTKVSEIDNYHESREMSKTDNDTSNKSGNESNSEKSTQA